MRNLKRALSLAMASIMLLGMMVIGAGAAGLDGFSDKDKVVNKEAVSVLTTLNVIKGKDDGNFDPTGTVTRAEMAKMICVVLNGGKDPQLNGNVASSYTDTASHWAKGYIEYCSNLGIVAGDGTGKFNPDATVTASQAAKMLLVAIGYNAAIEKYVGGSWQINVDVAANQNDLYDDLGNIDTSAAVNRDSAAQMVYNALEAQMVKYEYVVSTDGSVVTTKPQVTTSGLGNVLQEKFKASKVEAIVVSNEHAALNNNYAAADDAGKTTLEVISIDGSSTRAHTGTYNLVTDKDMLGQDVVVYIKYKNTVGYDEDDAIVIGSAIATNKNKIVTSTDGTELADLVDDNNLSLDGDTDYYVNYGGYYGGVVYGDNPANATLPTADKDNTVKTMTQAQFDDNAKMTGVTVKLIDNDGDKKVDYALAEKYSYGQVNKYSTTDKGSFRVQNVFNEDEYKSANVVGFENVAQGDLVLFTEFGGKIYVQKPETLEGKLESYSTSKKNVKLDGTTIKWSGLNGNTSSEQDWIGLYLTAGGSLDTTAMYFKDNNGYIFAVGEADESLLNYAVLLGYENQTKATGGTLGKDAKAKLLLSDGTVGTYTVATIDGNKVTDCTSAGVAGSGEVGFNAADQFNVYSFSKTDGGQMKLVYKSSVSHNEASTTVSYDRGKAYINVAGGNYTVTDRTIFLYQKPDGSVARYVGKTAPSIMDASKNPLTSQQVSVRESNGRGEALVVFLSNLKPSADFKDNFMYVYNTKVAQNGSSYEVSAIVDGKIDTYMVDSALNASGAEVILPDKNGAGIYQHTMPVGVYNYDKDGNIYSLTQVNVGSYAITGEVVAIRSDYIRIRDIGINGARAVGTEKSYSLTKDSMMFESRKNKTAQENATISVGDTATVVFNDDGKVIYGFLTQFSWEAGSTTPPTTGDKTVKFYTSEYTGYKFYVDGKEITTFTDAAVGVKSFAVKSGAAMTITGSAFNSLDTTKTYTVSSGVTAKATRSGIDFTVAADMTLDAPTTVAASGTGTTPPVDAIDKNITIDAACAGKPYITKAHVLTADDVKSGAAFNGRGSAGDLYIEFTLPNGMSAASDVDVDITKNGSTVAYANESLTAISGSTYYASFTPAPTIGTASVTVSVTSPVAGYSVILELPTGYQGKMTRNDISNTSPSTDVLDFQITKGIPTWATEVDIVFDLVGVDATTKMDLTNVKKGTGADAGHYVIKAAAVNSTPGAMDAGVDITTASASAQNDVTIKVLVVRVSEQNATFEKFNGIVVSETGGPVAIVVGTKTVIPAFEFTVPNLAGVAGLEVEYTISGVTADGTTGYGLTRTAKLTAPASTEPVNAATLASGKISIAADTAAHYTTTGDQVIITVNSVTYTKMALTNVKVSDVTGGTDVTTTAGTFTVAAASPSVGLVDSDANFVLTDDGDGTYSNQDEFAFKVTPSQNWTAAKTVKLTVMTGAGDALTFESNAPVATGGAAAATFTIEAGTLSGLTGGIVSFNIELIP